MADTEIGAKVGIKKDIPINTIQISFSFFINETWNENTELRLSSGNNTGCCNDCRGLFVF
jgi:Zn finger protein HypA/HybF involved in hydrogenase expression